MTLELGALDLRDFAKSSCHYRVATYLARSTLPRRDDLRIWSRAAGPHQRGEVAKIGNGTTAR
jgi:hypothetical protein